MHPVVRDAIAAEPDIGSGDASKCLPGWLNSFAEKFQAGEGWDMGPSCVRALFHTLIAAQQRTARLVRERDEVLNSLLNLKGNSDESGQMGIPGPASDD